MLRNSFVIILSFVLSFSAYAEISDPTGVFNEGSKLYEEHNYEDAKNAYSQLIDKAYYSPELYLNLGNTHYKLNDVPDAILYYEKALKLDPGNADILHNLKLANNRVSDKNNINESVRLNDWFFMWISNSPNYWAYHSIHLFIIGFALFVLFLFSKSRKLKKLTFYTGIIALFLGVIAISFSGFHKEKLTSVEDAIIFKPSIDLMTEPSENSSIAFVLHEGTKVKIMDETELWFEIKFSDGKIGWLQKEFVQTI